MPARATRPYALDDAVDDEQQFWRDVRKIIGEEVERAFVKRGFDDLVGELKSVARTHKLLIERVNEFGRQQTGMASDLDRVIGHITVKSADDDLLRMKLDKFFELVTPKDPPKTPP